MSRNSERLEVKHKFSRHLQSSDQEVRFEGLLGKQIMEFSQKLNSESPMMPMIRKWSWKHVPQKQFQ